MKTNIGTVFKGIGIWIILLIFNTRSGEAGANLIKIIIDIVLAVMLTSGNKKERQVAIGFTAMTLVITWLTIPEPIEEMVLIVLAVLGGMFLKSYPLNNEEEFEGTDYGSTHSSVVHEDAIWRAKNVFWPFESYSYSHDEGIHIRKGILKRTFLVIPTSNIRMKVDQSALQTLLGLCDVTFLNNYNGQVFGEEGLHNILIKSAMELIQRTT